MSDTIHPTIDQIIDFHHAPLPASLFPHKPKLINKFLVNALLHHAGTLFITWPLLIQHPHNVTPLYAFFLNTKTHSSAASPPNVTQLSALTNLNKCYQVLIIHIQSPKGSFYDPSFNLRSQLCTHHVPHASLLGHCRPSLNHLYLLNPLHVSHNSPVSIHRKRRLMTSLLLGSNIIRQALVDSIVVCESVTPYVDTWIDLAVLLNGHAFRHLVPVRHQPRPVTADPTTDRDDNRDLDEDNPFSNLVAHLEQRAYLQQPTDQSIPLNLVGVRIATSDSSDSDLSSHSAFSCSEDECVPTLNMIHLDKPLPAHLVNAPYSPTAAADELERYIDSYKSQQDAIQLLKYSNLKKHPVLTQKQRGRFENELNRIAKIDIPRLSTKVISQSSSWSDLMHSKSALNVYIEDWVKLLVKLNFVPAAPVPENLVGYHPNALKLSDSLGGTEFPDDSIDLFDPNPSSSSSEFTDDDNWLLDFIVPDDDNVFGADLLAPNTQMSTSSSSSIAPKSSEPLITPNLVQELHQAQLNPELAPDSSSLPNDFVELEPKLNINIGSDANVIYIPDFLENILQDHQINGIRFLWERAVSEGKGAILAHAMGLGKSIQIVAFMYILFREIHKHKLQCEPALQSRRFMILCPKTVYPNWENEFYKWIPKKNIEWVKLSIYVLDRESQSRREALLEQWDAYGGILLASYDCLKSTINSKKYTAHDGQRETRLIQTLITNVALLIMDEAHVVKNAETKLNGLLKSNLSTNAVRIGLTGTPLANNLDEYYRLSDLVAPGYLGTQTQFEITRDRIMKGQHFESTVAERRASEYALELLSHTLDEFVCRQDNSVLLSKLPPIQEVVVFLEPTDKQKEMIIQVMRTNSMDDAGGFMKIHNLICYILNHPSILVRQILESRGKETTVEILNSTDADNTPRMSMMVGGKEVELVVISDSDEDSTLDADIPIPNASASGSTVRPDDSSDNNCVKSMGEWIDEYVSSIDHVDSPELSSKTMFALDLLRECVAMNEKMIIFSHSVKCLDSLSRSIRSAGFNYCILEGSMDTARREASIAQFGCEEIEYPVILISTRAGSTGINLIRASRVIIFDFDYNPVHEEQAIARAYRIGQVRPVYVYRFVVPDTVSDGMFKQQVRKSMLARQTLDKERFHRLFNKADLKIQINPKEIIKRMSRPIEKSCLDPAILESDAVLGKVVSRSAYVTKLEGIEKYFPNQGPELNTKKLAEAHAQAQTQRENVRTGRSKAAHFEVPALANFVDEEVDERGFETNESLDPVIDLPPRISSRCSLESIPNTIGMIHDSKTPVGVSELNVGPKSETPEVITDRVPLGEVIDLTLDTDDEDEQSQAPIQLTCSREPRRGLKTVLRKRKRRRSLTNAATDIHPSPPITVDPKLGFVNPSTPPLFLQNEEFKPRKLARKPSDLPSDVGAGGDLQPPNQIAYLPRAVSQEKLGEVPTRSIS